MFENRKVREEELKLSAEFGLFTTFGHGCHQIKRDNTFYFGNVDSHQVVSVIYNLLIFFVFKLVLVVIFPLIA